MAMGHSSLFALSACTRLISLLSLCLLLLAPVYAQNRTDEVSALYEFHSSFKKSPLSGSRSGYSIISWNFSDENACAWVGVTCTTNFTVAELDLSARLTLSEPGNEQSSTASFSPLSGLRDLHHLDLSSNNLGLDGQLSLSYDIRTLTGLTWLDVSQNNLVGWIPDSISSCRRLRFLALEQNGFYGTIPSTLSELKDLRFPFLAHNNLSGSFPTELAALTSLVSIDLSDNSFNSIIPALTSLTKLVSLKLDNNSFTKFEESWFSTIPQGLEVLSVSFNQLADVLPSNITVPNLQFFNVLDNRLSGQISSFSRRCQSISVDLSQNQRTCDIPSDLFVSATPDYQYSLPEGNVEHRGYPLPLSPQDLQGKGLQWWVVLIMGGGSFIGAGAVIVFLEGKDLKWWAVTMIICGFIVGDVMIVSLGSATLLWYTWVYQRSHQRDADVINALLERE